MTADEAFIRLKDLRTNNESAREIAKEMMCHSRMNKKSCAKALLKQHPSEDKAVFEWRMANFVHITYPLFEKAVNSLHRIFQATDHHWSASDHVTEYLKTAKFGENRVYFNVFISQYLLRAMIEDPNAWLVVLPKMPVPAQSNLSPEIDLKVVWSCRQVYRDEDVIIFSDHDLGGMYGSVLQSGYIVDADKVIRFQKAENSDWYVRKDEYQYKLNEIPYSILGGNLTTDGIYTSFFQSFVEYGNQALAFFSEWQVTKSTCTFPIKEVEPTPCNTCKGSGFVDGKTCDSCNGTKYNQQAFTPATVLVRPVRRVGEPERTQPMIQYHSPPVDVIQEQKSDWMLMLDKALESINMKFVLEAQSGVAKDLDRTEFYSFLGKISDMLYQHEETALDFMEKLRHYQNAEGVYVKKPSSFSLLTEADLMSLVENSFSIQDVPLRIIAMKDYYLGRYSDNPQELKRHFFILYYDRYAGHTDDEINVKVDQGVITQDESAVHSLVPHELNKLIYDKTNEILPDGTKNESWFIDATYDQITAELDGRIAKQLARQEQERQDALPN